MSKNKIYKILREYSHSWEGQQSTKPVNPNRFKFIEYVLKRYFKNLKRVKKVGRYDIERGESEELTYDNFIKTLKDSFPGSPGKSQINPPYHNFGDVIQMIFKNQYKYDISGFDPYIIMRLISEYVLNYGESDYKNKVDVVKSYEIEDYIEQQFLLCDDKFFETMWDDFLPKQSLIWGETIKERMWDEIKGEVMEKMEDEEWQEENGVSFDRIEYEEDYFHTYWHYPIQSLGWDKWQLCEWYRYYVERDLVSFFFPSEEIGRSKKWGIMPLGSYDVYFIHRNKFFM